MRAHLPELGRVLVVSVLALLVDAGTLAILTSVLGAPYQAAGFAGFMAGLAANYLLSVRWAFQERRLADGRVELLWFAAIGLLGAGWNALLLWLGVERLGWPLWFAKAASVGMVFFWNYGVRKWLLFTKKPV